MSIFRKLHLNTTIKVLFFYVIFYFFDNQVDAQSKYQQIKEAVNTIQESDWMRGGSISFHVKSLSGKPLEYGYNEETSLTPASITKLFTTGIGLKKLGEAFKYETKVSYSGQITEGVLDGDLIIHGAGDPTLQLRSLDSAIVASIPSLKKITGKVIIDASLYGQVTTPPKWVWEDLGNYYGAGVASLNINDNMYYLYLKTGNEGQVASIVDINPKTPYLKVESEVLAGKKGTGDNSFIFSSPYSDSHIIRGTLPPNRSSFKVKGGITNPDYHAGWILADTLISQGIDLDKNEIEVVYDKNKLPVVKPLCSVFSHDLSWIINKTNKKSINLYAEAIIKTVSINETGSILPEDITSTLLSCIEEVGVDTQGLFLEDGSGLSPFGAFSAKHMTQYLGLMTKETVYPSFFKSLAVTGTSGTLKYFCRYNSAKGKVTGKSGSMRRVRSYAGFVKTSSKETLVFTVIVNNFSCKSKQVRKALEPLMDIMAK
ncbi:D-alanyl-D-alanine carboxypeptidase/D-alanyl-D-alanine endopeptidase [Flammeovirga kamogawensis]|uniref:D-alanyl-D-alanine carboxypeptidase/D-alanyl-D-alanine-endopeptidase n=1 Tax=Flammeovirga kamogawensis TaxID=373891 RepID=A0ABX8GTS6_9BACT|nr:D-alanyl-D-alanine carboxypeptidase/D-alanyl-D-alanine-endopeptidase [Flammeovirga kamogawensis]MBB6463023.1 D-alanyl-D-alanine carboxypeptidase/D-alanyl-D-alanine-endopeptidase (penicillin-binding protein 4) [Flammeovirga kamogawensis]QWG06547.1 D-alanyl-D-alanine carboxypeptidase/D-alanyl-D-alanine-endopeptidase [Flammeovirga kamogawensis]TRX68376.1 D-alanyl-D-alanine carboxypeptidase/D-alanyl-D-alanine-endopeptidase [Flammeovirga kamogawensis]